MTSPRRIETFVSVLLFSSLFFFFICTIDGFFHLSIQILTMPALFCLSFLCHFLAGFAGLYGHSSVAITDNTKTVHQILVMGGYTNYYGDPTNAIWKSVDGGRTWSYVSPAGWSGTRSKNKL